MHFTETKAERGRDSQRETNRQTETVTVTERERQRERENLMWLISLKRYWEFDEKRAERTSSVFFSDCAITENV